MSRHAEVGEREREGTHPSSSEDFVHPQVHPLQDVPAAVVDDATDLRGVEGAREVGVNVVVVVQAATVMDRRVENRHRHAISQVALIFRRGNFPD